MGGDGESRRVGWLPFRGGSIVFTGLNCSLPECLRGLVGVQPVERFGVLAPATVTL